MKFARYKLIFNFLIAAAVSFGFFKFERTIEESILFGWLTFGFLYILESCYVVFTINSKEITKRSSDEDLGIWVQFFLLTLVCSTALVTIIFWRNDSTQLGKSNLLHQLMFITSVAFAWIILHLSFTFRYAHLYYGDENENYKKHARGLDFPDDEHPDYIDFAYYSFTIGMTFQVSDVTVKTKGLRRLTLVHSLFSFLFNTILVAITINEIINL